MTSYYDGPGDSGAFAPANASVEFNFPSLLSNYSNCSLHWYDDSNTLDGSSYFQCNPTAGIVLLNASVTTDRYQVFMGQPPSQMQARQVFANNQSGGFFYRWNTRLKTWYPKINASTVGIRDDLWHDFSTDASYCITSQGAPQLPLDQSVIYYPDMSGDLTSWFSGPCTLSGGMGACQYNVSEPFHLDFAPQGNGLPFDGEIGALSGGGVQGKENLIPYANNTLGQDDGLQIVIDANASGQKALKMTCYLIQKGGKWTPGFCGSLITAHKFASGEFTVRAKVQNRPALIWALWTFYGNYQTPAARQKSKCGSGDCNKCLACTFWEDCCERRYTQACSGSNVDSCGENGNSSYWKCTHDTCTPKNIICSSNDKCDSVGQRCLNNGSSGLCGLSCEKVSSICSNNMDGSACDAQQGYGQVGICKSEYSLDPMWPFQDLSESNQQDLFTLGGAPCSLNPNHEIDIEIPSNAPQVVHPCTAGQACKGVMATNTLNMNTYRWTNSAGTGTYNNLFVVRSDSDGSPVPFLDNSYHKYTFKWHTGTYADRSDPNMIPPYHDEPLGCDATGGQTDNKCTYIRPRVDFYFDDVYIGTNDAMVPTIAGRYWVQQWFKEKATGGWNGLLNRAVCKNNNKSEPCPYGEVSIDYVTIKPYHQERDMYFAEIIDQPQMVDQTQKLPGACSIYRLPREGGSWSYRAALTQGTDCQYGLSPQATQTFIPFAADNRNLIGSVCDKTNLPCAQDLITKSSDCSNGATFDSKAKQCVCQPSWAGPDCNTPCNETCSSMKYACGKVCGQTCGLDNSAGMTCVNHQYSDNCLVGGCDTAECITLNSSNGSVDCKRCVPTHIVDTTEASCFELTRQKANKPMSELFHCQHDSESGSTLATDPKVATPKIMTDVCIEMGNSSGPTYYCKFSGDCQAN